MSNFIYVVFKTLWRIPVVIALVYLFLNVVAFVNNSIKLSDYAYQVQRIVAENNTIKKEYVPALATMQLKCLNANVSEIKLIGGSDYNQNTTTITKDGYCNIMTTRYRNYTTEDATDLEYNVKVNVYSDENQIDYQFGDVYPVYITWKFVPYIPYATVNTVYGENGSGSTDMQEVGGVSEWKGIDTPITQYTGLFSTSGTNRLQEGFNGKDIGYRNSRFEIVSKYVFPCLRYYPDRQVNR